jgi:hypothetical protein
MLEVLLALLVAGCAYRAAPPPKHPDFAERIDPEIAVVGAYADMLYHCNAGFELARAPESMTHIDTLPPIQEERWTLNVCDNMLKFTLDCRGVTCEDHDWPPRPGLATILQAQLTVAMSKAHRSDGFRLRVLPRARRDDSAAHIEMELVQDRQTRRLTIDCDGEPIRCRLLPEEERRGVEGPQLPAQAH